MAFQVGRGNRTVLYGIPEAPPYFLNITRVAGIYIVGFTHYLGWRPSIVPRIQRSFDNTVVIPRQVEEFITGILAVILISLFAEIVQTFLLRKENKSVSENGLRTAYMLDEYSHFRNLWRKMTSRGPSTQNMFNITFRQRSSLLSIFVLLFATFIFVADVMAVFATRSRTFTSTADQLNLRGMLPIGTTEGIARKIRSFTQEKPCILPIAKFERQTKHFRLAGCVEYDSGPRILPPEEDTDTVTMRSWYHEGGSDHNVSFAKKWFSVKTRAEVYFEGEPLMKRILFQRSNTWEEDTRFLHNLTIYNAMQFSCNNKKADHDCVEILEELQYGGEEQEEREITLWERGGNPINISVIGLKSKYTVPLHKQVNSISRALQVLAASTAVLEVQGSGWYEEELSGKRETRIEGLMTEEGRNAGIILLLVLVVSCGLLLLGLRILLDPISIAEMAMMYHLAARKARLKRNLGAEKGVEAGEIQKRLGEEMGFVKEKMQSDFSKRSRLSRADVLLFQEDHFEELHQREYRDDDGGSR